MAEDVVDAEDIGKPADWVEQHADYLFSYACSRVYDPNLAEDLVQEAFLAAVRDRDRCSGKSSLRTWLVGILRHKIIDHFRSAAFQERRSLETFYSEEAPLHFDARGHWRESAPTTPSSWPSEQEARLQDREFRQQFESCLQRLPPRVRDIFVLREMEQLSTEEICEVLDITRNNVCSVLHRARMALRDCLDAKWFQVGAFRKGASNRSAPVKGSI